MTDTHPIQTAIKDYLEGLAYFKGPPPIPVIARIESDLEQVLAERTVGYDSGILAIIHPPYGTNVSTHGNQVVIDWTISIDIIEWGVFSQATSGANKTGYDVALEMAAPPKALSQSGRNGLHGVRLAGYQPLFFTSIQPLQVATEDALVNNHQVQFSTKYHL